MSNTNTIAGDRTSSLETNLDRCAAILGVNRNATVDEIYAAFDRKLDSKPFVLTKPEGPITTDLARITETLQTMAIDAKEDKPKRLELEEATLVMRACVALVRAAGKTGLGVLRGDFTHDDDAALSPEPTYPQTPSVVHMKSLDAQNFDQKQEVLNRRAAGPIQFNLPIRER